MSDDAQSNDPLIAFSAGRISKEQAIEALRLRDYASLLIMLGAADLPLPRLPPDLAGSMYLAGGCWWLDPGQRNPDSQGARVYRPRVQRAPSGGRRAAPRRR